MPENRDEVSVLSYCRPCESVVSDKERSASAFKEARIFDLNCRSDSVITMRPLESTVHPKSCGSRVKAEHAPWIAVL